jgi:nucleotide-binding universal stress UspA family protein
MFTNVVVFVNNLQDHGYFAYIAALAKRQDTAVVLLGCSQGNSESTDPVAWHLNQIEAELEINQAVETLKKEGISASGVLLNCPPHTTLAQVLARHVTEVNADTLILTDSARQLLLEPALWQTGVTVNVLNSSLPLDEPVSHVRRVLVPLDCSLRAECVLPAARQISQIMQAELLLAHVVGCTDMPPRLQHDARIARLMSQVVEYKRVEGQRYLEQVQASMTTGVETRLVVDGNVRHALHDIAAQEGVSMVVLSAHGQSSNTNWPYGSVTYSFIAHSSLPLLIVQDTDATAVTALRGTTAHLETRRNHVA